MNKVSLKYLACIFLILSTSLIAQKDDFSASDFLEKGKDQLLFGKYSESVISLEKALNQFKVSKNQSKIAETYNLLSEAFQLNSAFEDALSSAKLALENSHNDKLEKANAYDNLGTVQTLIGEFKNAEKNLQLAFNIRSKYFKEDKYGLAKNYYNQGQLLRITGDYNNALIILKKALTMCGELDKKPKNIVLSAIINEASGFVNYDLSNFDTALVFFEKNLNLFNVIYEKNNPRFVEVYNNLGLVYSIKELFNESLKYYNKALSVSINNYGMDMHPSQARLNYNIGTIYLRQNQKEKALYHTEKCLKMAINTFGENHRNLFFPYSQMGLVHNDEEGIPYIMKALEICKNSEKPSLLRISFLYQYLCMIYENIENYHEALNYAKKSYELRLKIYNESNYNIIESLNFISKFYLNLNDYENAISYNKLSQKTNYIENKYDSKLNERESLNTSYIDSDLFLETIKIEADIYLGIFKSNNSYEDLAQSNSLYKKAESLINMLRNKKRNYEDKIKFSAITKSIYSKIIETQLLLNKSNDKNTSISELFHFSEKSRANVLREIVKNTDVKKLSNINPEILKLEKEIDIKIAKLTSEVLNQVSDNSQDKAKFYELEGQLLDLSRKKDSLEKRIENDYPKYYQLKYEKNIIEISDLQKQLDETTTFIEFLKSDDILYAFSITKDSVHINELSVEGLNKKIESFNESIESKDHHNYVEEGRELYQLLIEPIRKHFVRDKLIIVPDESLWHLQFDLLLPNENDRNITQPNYLLFDYAISYANSASLLFEKKLPDDSKQLLNECIAFSYTGSDSIVKNSKSIALRDFRDSKTDLPGTRREIEELSKIFNGQYFYSNNANESNFKNNVNRYKLVHLALHADIDSLNPKNLKIKFSDKSTSIEDNELFAHELYGLDIPADLVVLSACNTGVGRINKGEGILSLGNAFQYAGAKSLMLSRWKISDETTPEVMKLFYKNIDQGMDKSKALQQAKMDYLNTTDLLTAAPLYWGSFYILGSTEPIDLHGKSQNWYYYLVTLIILVLTSYIIRKIK